MECFMKCSFHWRAWSIVSILWKPGADFSLLFSIPPPADPFSLYELCDEETHAAHFISTGLTVNLNKRVWPLRRRLSTDQGNSPCKCLVPSLVRLPSAFYKSSFDWLCPDSSNVGSLTQIDIIIRGWADPDSKRLVLSVWKWPLPLLFPILFQSSWDSHTLAQKRGRTPWSFPAHP